MTGHHVRRTSVVVVLLLWAVLQPLSSRGGTGEPEADRAYEVWKEGAGLHLEQQYEAAIERYKEALALHPTGRTHTYPA